MQWYYTSDQQQSILHARLSMLCSPLNDHLYSLNHVQDSRTCSRRHVWENNKHVLECPFHTNERNQMINDIKALGFEPPLKFSCTVMKAILKRLTKLPLVLFKSSLR